VTFDAITEKAIKESFTKSRKIDFSLVHAQEARRAIDRLVGYSVSPLISGKAGMTLSAGRVQSVALRFIVELEAFIQKFTKQKHYGVLATFDNWVAHWDSSSFTTEDRPYVTDEILVKKIACAKKFKVISSEQKLRKRNAPSPFSTSLLLQSASSQLKFNPQKTSGLAQKLFEQGHITYIRTDSVNFAEEAITEIRTLATQKNWPIPDLPNKFKSKEGSQEAHEAIRPTHIEIESAGTTEEEKALYRLIWLRSVASQLAPSEYEDNILQLTTEDLDIAYTFRAKGSLLVKKGWQTLLNIEEKEEVNSVPLLATDTIITGDCSVQNKETQPPKRYTEASLIKKLEVSGIGRPSTYATTINSLVKKSYIASDSKSILTPTKIGINIVKLLVESRFSFMEYAFTASIEQYLDEIAEDKSSYLQVVSSYYEKLELEITTLKASNILKPMHSCKKCSSALRLIKSKKNNQFYWVCQNEQCKTIISDNNGKPLEDRECPKCKQAFRRFNKKSGEGAFWGCQNKDCNLIVDDFNNKPIQESFPPCPKCQKPLFKQNGQFGMYWHCRACKNNIKIKKK